VHEIFQQLTGLGRANDLKCMWQSPFTLHRRVMESIAHEAENAKAGKPARIIAKIDLIIRGVCVLRPRVPGLSDNITVRSTIGRFLEHSRIFYFKNGGKDDVFLSSADWMDRNFFRRVELAFPVLDKALKRRVMEEGLKVHLRDNALSWVMKPDGTYRLRRVTGDKRRASQELLLPA